MDVEGRVVQMGKHQELIAQDGLYKQLVQRQLMGSLGFYDILRILIDIQFINFMKKWQWNGNELT